MFTTDGQLTLQLAADELEFSTRMFTTDGQLSPQPTAELDQDKTTIRQMVLLNNRSGHGQRWFKKESEQRGFTYKCNNVMMNLCVFVCQ